MAGGGGFLAGEAGDVGLVACVALAMERVGGVFAGTEAVPCLRAVDDVAGAAVCGGWVCRGA